MIYEILIYCVQLSLVMFSCTAISWHSQDLSNEIKMLHN